MNISDELTENTFERVSNMIYKLAGINMTSGKKALVQSRLSKRLRATGISDYDSYIKYIKSPSGKAELSIMVDSLTTNKTGFFREMAHFDFIRNHIVGELNDKRLRFWSAACSSGEEPYTLSMVLTEVLPQINRYDIGILATDISNRMLAHARKGIYAADDLRDVPGQLRKKYFKPVRTDGKNSLKSQAYRIHAAIRKPIHFGRLNLMGPWPMKGPFQLILCRNVLIYFDRPTRNKLINRFWDLLASGGYLFVGHSEGLSGTSHQFQYVKPAIYQK